MTEKELLEHAKTYVDKMANGVNPLTDEPVKDDDLINNVRISRCLFYVSGVLANVIAGNVSEKPKKTPKTAFSLTYEEREKIAFSETPIGISDLTDRINACRRDDTVKKLSTMKIAGWLLEKGFMKQTERENGKNVKRPTAAGRELGITLEERTGQYGPYDVVLYNLSAQHFIVDNLDEISASI